MNAEQQQLALKHMKLAVYWARRFRSRLLPWSDACQAAYYGLCRAADCWEGPPEQFPHLAGKWIRGAILHELRRERMEIILRRQLGAGLIASGADQLVRLPDLRPIRRRPGRSLPSDKPLQADAS